MLASSEELGDAQWVNPGLWRASDTAVQQCQSATLVTDPVARKQVGRKIVAGLCWIVLDCAAAASS
jgi:hypothetical protein